MHEYWSGYRNMDENWKLMHQLPIVSVKCLLTLAVKLSPQSEENFRSCRETWSKQNCELWLVWQETKLVPRLPEKHLPFCPLKDVPLLSSSSTATAPAGGALCSSCASTALKMAGQGLAISKQFQSPYCAVSCAVSGTSEGKGENKILYIMFMFLHVQIK